MTISSESTDFPITLLNPEENPCNFKFTLSLQETGETLCTTDYSSGLFLFIISLIF